MFIYQKRQKYQADLEKYFTNIENLESKKESTGVNLMKKSR